MDNVKQKLVEDNMKLVYFIISREYPTYIKDDDVIQSGMVGLCLAAEAWQEDGLFSTYAGKCIRREIHREFARRKSYSKVVSLDSPIGEDGVLGDVIPDECSVVYIDSKFYETLTEDESAVLQLINTGHKTDEISELKGFSIQKVQKIVRTIKKKWRKFNED